ncbi:integrase [Rhodopirellula europaea SH398]|uniref:Integrase n=1 Tax=Rhodopirellula europaea SH398 TaxID=1263868 RepID=M5RWI2_9BACT|nr:integrase [Rhodopirellula europaea SH398]
MQTTEAYLPLTRLGDERARLIVAQIMNGDQSEQRLSSVALPWF